MKLFANAKINLTLDVLRKRSDGFHDIKTIMQTLRLSDEIVLKKCEKGISISGTGGKIAYDETNLAYRAAELFFKKSGISVGAEIYIQKNIPVCAGLAGGSSDAAAVLCGLNELYSEPFERAALLKIGAHIGADVPYCIMKGTAMAEGTGDVLTPLVPFKQTPVLLVKPDIDVPTPWAYGSLRLGGIAHPDADRAAECLKRGNYEELYRVCGNVFETVVFAKYPVAGEIKAQMLAHGASLALMSGSGPTIFGIFENEENAKNAYNSFKNKFKETILTKSCNV